MVPVKKAVKKDADAAGLCDVCKKPIAHLNMSDWTTHQLECKRVQKNAVVAERTVAAIRAEHEASNAAKEKGRAHTKQEMKKKYKGG